MQWSHRQIEFRLVNGVQGDPALYVFFHRTGEACLFDAGLLEELGSAELLKVRKVFLSHTHIDHFIGFDRLLRTNIPHFRELEISGPVGIAANVKGKLEGYTWNLLEKDQLNFLIHEIHEQGRVKHFHMKNENAFCKLNAEAPASVLEAHLRPMPVSPAAFMTNLLDGSRMEAVCLDHGISSVAYLCQGNVRFHVDEDSIHKKGFKPGVWIGDLQRHIAKGEFNERIEVGEKNYKCGDLAAEIMTYEIPRLFAYATDIRFSADNLKRLFGLMECVEIFICESCFADEDLAHAVAKKHLTTKQAALLGAYCRADDLKTFHYSRTYRGTGKDLAAEAQGFFTAFKKLSQEDLEAEVGLELKRIEGLKKN